MTARRVGLALLAIYIGSVVAANLLTTQYGRVTIAPGLAATAGTFAICGVIMTRDLLQDALGRIAVLLAIFIGGGLSYLLASHKIAVASLITFLVAESLEFTVYTPLRRHVGWGTGQWSGVVSAANLTGILADTLLFLWLAGFALTWPVIAGQLVGKAYVTVGVVGLGVMLRRAVPHPAIDRASA